MTPSDYPWIEFIRTDDPFWNAVRGNLVAFLAFDPVKGTARSLGSGFIVGNAFDVEGVGKNFLMVLTAKHVLEDAYKYQDINKHSMRASSVPSVLFSDRVSLDEDKIRAMWMGTTGGDMMRVRHITYANNLDVAMCILEPQDAARQTAMLEAPGVRFDVTMPPVGTTVHIVSLTDYSIDGGPIVQDSIITIKNRPFIRKGTVIAHESSAMGHNGPCFRVNTPTIGGMSGGFAYVPEPYGSLIGACGIVSSSQEIEKPHHFTTEGDTILAPTLGALGLELPFLKTPTEKIRIFDLIKDGHIEDIRKSPDKFSMSMTEGSGLILKVDE